jgi:hypothetical protein
MNVLRPMLDANQGNAGLALGAGELAALPVGALGGDVGLGPAARLPQLAHLAIAGWQGEPPPLRT